MPALTQEQRDARFERLPLWAKKEIERLNRNLLEANARLAQGPDGSNTYADPYNDTPRPLGKDTSIDFRLKDTPGFGSHITCRIDRDHHGKPYLDLMGSDSIAIEPTSSNCVRVRLVER